MIAFGLMLLCVSSILARPSEEPTKISLSPIQRTIENLGEATANRVQQGRELFDNFADTIRFGRGKLVHSATMARNIIVERAEEVASEARNNVASTIAATNDIIAQGREAIESYPNYKPFFDILPPITRESAHLESERGQSLLEKPPMSVVQGFFERFLRPVPLVDTIKEEEKYGNSGDRLIPLGKAIVGGYEGLSNLLNSIIDFPVDKAKQTSRRLTATLNQFGARLVGLAR